MNGVRGVAIEGVSDSGGPVRAVALVAEGRSPFYSTRGYSTLELLPRLMQLSDTGGDLVTYGVDYFAALLFRDCPFEALCGLWRGERVRIGHLDCSFVPTRYVWLWDPSARISCRVSDVRRWGADTLPETCDLFEVDHPGRIPYRWRLSTGDELEALHLAERMSQTYGEIGRGVQGALKRAGLPGYWRDGSGRVAGALLDKMATVDDIQQYPGAIRKPIWTAFFGGRIQVTTVGRWDQVTQLDIRSAYPHAMTELPSLAGAKWRRARSYDPERPHALWYVRWEVPYGARIGPFPVRRDGEVLYPLSGAGWYWDREVRSAVNLFGSSIQPAHGFYIVPATDRKPFAPISDYYQKRAELRDSGDRAAAHALKLTLTSLSGRLAQEVTPDGSRGRWANLALAGMVTSATRARVLDMFADHWETAAAVATDSVTIRGDAGVAGSRALGGVGVETGEDAILLPSGAYHVAGGAAMMDRLSGIDRNRSRLIDWDAVRREWDIMGLALSYQLPIPYFVGIGMAANGGAADFCRWRMIRRDICGGSYWRKAARTGYRQWDLLPHAGAPVESEMYVPRPGVLSRLPDQGFIPIGDVIEEHGMPG